MKVLHLERSGYTVLCFDHGGTGDSMGDSDSVSVAGPRRGRRRGAHRGRRPPAARVRRALGRGVRDNTRPYAPA